MFTYVYTPSHRVNKRCSHYMYMYSLGVCMAHKTRENYFHLRHHMYIITCYMYSVISLEMNTTKQNMLMIYCICSSKLAISAGCIQRYNVCVHVHTKTQRYDLVSQTYSRDGPLELVSLINGRSNATKELFFCCFEKFSQGHRDLFSLDLRR